MALFNRKATATQILQHHFNALAGGVTGHIGTSPQWWIDDPPSGIEIDPSILAVTSERTERSIRIDFRQITCPCNHISLIRLEYSTDGHDTDDVKFTCPACGQEDKIHLVDIHPDGANVKIIETWQVGSDVKWDDRNVRQHSIQHSIQPQGPIEIRVLPIREYRPSHRRECRFSVYYTVDAYLFEMQGGNKHRVVEEIARRMSEHIYKELMTGVKP